MKLGKLTITWGTPDSAPAPSKQSWTGPIPPPPPDPEPTDYSWDSGGGPAFPARNANWNYAGMARRYWTAVQILAGKMHGGWRPDNRAETIAYCFAMADAMIAEDEGEETTEPPAKENPL